MIVCPHCLEISHSATRCDVCGVGIGEAGTPLPHLDDGFVLDPGPPIGQGSFATVHGATSLVDGHRWAVKLVNLRKASESARVRQQLRASFIREATTLMVLQHPHLVRVVSFGARDPDTLYMAMDLIPGGQTLQRVLQRAVTRGKKPGVNTILRVLEEIGSALAYVHERSVVHRDLKPANIGIDENKRFKLLDFGLVKVLGEGFGAAHDAVTVAGWGSYNYGAPEQFFDGTVGPWTDVYALGSVVYEMIAGRPPVCDGTIQRILDAMNRPAEPLPEDAERPVALDRLVMAMLEKNHEHRLQSMGEVLARVKEIRRSFRKAAESPADSLSKNLGPTPVPRVVVTRTRRGDETRPADPRAAELLMAMREGSIPTDVLPKLPARPSFDPAPSMDPKPEPAMVGAGATAATAQALEATELTAPAWLIPAAGVTAVLSGLAGLWWVMTAYTP